MPTAPTPSPAAKPATKSAAKPQARPAGQSAASKPVAAAPAAGGYHQQRAQNQPGPKKPAPKSPPAPVPGAAPVKPKENLGVPGQAAVGKVASGAEQLPETLQELPSGKRVAHGTDAGNFYCEHMFYATQKEAAKPGSSVAKNAEGESLTGFLHLPGDREATADAAEGYKRKDSGKDARAVVGSALRGWIDTALPKAGSGPVRMLLTGYGNWGSVVDNPTGAFVSSKRNLDAAMTKAFGPAELLTKSGAEIDKAAGPKMNYTTWSYKVKIAGLVREVQLRGQVFPVADEAIDKGPQSVQAAMGQFAPHGVLSMGVAVGREDFLAEHHADDGGLDKSGKKHQDGAAPRHEMPDNYALARGILDGQRGSS